MIARLWNQLNQSHHIVAQIIRYGVTGGGVTFAAVAVYLFCAYPLAIRPMIANVIAWIFAVVSGYFIHSRWSFRNHGSSAQEHVLAGRFFIAALIGLGLNSFWVWLTTEWFGGPQWWPVPLLVIATPALVFPLNKYWVFS